MLYLMRHGEAEARAATDYDRALTERGMLQVRRAAGFLPDASLELLHSPYRRTRETARLVSEYHEIRVKQAATWLEPGASVACVLEQLAAFEPRNTVVVLVSHNPLVSLLAAELAGEAPHSVHFGTASLARLAGEPWAPGCMDLYWESY